MNARCVDHTHLFLRIPWDRVFLQPMGFGGPLEEFLFQLFIEIGWQCFISVSLISHVYFFGALLTLHIYTLLCLTDVLFYLEKEVYDQNFKTTKRCTSSICIEPRTRASESFPFPWRYNTCKLSHMLHVTRHTTKK